MDVKGIISDLHSMEKIGLSAFDTKRSICDYGIKCMHLETGRRNVNYLCKHTTKINIFYLSSPSGTRQGKGGVLWLLSLTGAKVAQGQYSSYFLIWLKDHEQGKVGGAAGAIISL